MRGGGYWLDLGSLDCNPISFHCPGQCSQPSWACVSSETVGSALLGCLPGSKEAVLCRQDPGGGGEGSQGGRIYVYPR